MSSKKRKLEKEEDSLEPVSNPKKRRLNQHKEAHNALFENGHYYAEFSMTYNAIAETKKSIPSNIIYEISQFATGEVYICKECDDGNETLIMNLEKMKSMKLAALRNPVEILSDAEMDPHRIKMTGNIHIFCSRECQPKADGLEFNWDYWYGRGVAVCCPDRLVHSVGRCECSRLFIECPEHNDICSDCNVPKCNPRYTSYELGCRFHGRAHCCICGQEKCKSWMEYNDLQTNSEDHYMCSEHCTYYDVDCTCDPDYQSSFFTWKDADGQEHYNEEENSEWSACSRCPRGICFRCSDEQWNSFHCATCCGIQRKNGTFDSRAYANLCSICDQKNNTPKCGICHIKMVREGTEHDD